ncbi:MAG: SDR family oxidoreductase [Daejeonella sp.]
MKNKSVISILGCGWLGLPLAAHLVSKGYSVKASTTSDRKKTVLERLKIDHYVIHFSEITPISKLSEFIRCDILIIAIPPGRKSNHDQNNYRQMVNHLIPLLAKSKIKKLILISSTSVYGDVNSIVTEIDQPLPETESGKLLLETENVFMQLKGIQVVILRLAGLIGQGRFPGRFFAGKTAIPNGLAPVNLVHQYDVIDLIENLIEIDGSQGIYNVCAPSHPTKEEFYTLAAEMAGLNKPQFIAEKTNWKIVRSNRLENELDFTFKVADLMEWLRSGKAEKEYNL